MPKADPAGVDDPSGHRSNLRLVPYLLVAMAVFLAIEPGWSDVPRVFRGILSRVGTLKTAIIVATWIFAALSVAVLLIHRSAWIRWPMAVITVLGSVLQLGMERLNGYGFDLWEANLFFAERDQARDAFDTYAGPFLPPLILVLCVTAACMRVGRDFLPRLTSKKWAALFLAALMPVGGVIHQTDGVTANFPAPFKVAALFGIASMPRQIASEREEPFIQPARTPLVQHVIFVVDESVRGDFLSINGWGPKTSPRLEKREGSFINYGVACAAANSSAPSNIILQSGVTGEELHETPRLAETKPSLFQYAQLAGAKTSLFAGQQLRSWYYMSPNELNVIDHYAQVREQMAGEEDWKVDPELSRQLCDWLDPDQPTFSYVLKLGAHFRYVDKYPKDFEPFGMAAFEFEPDEARRERLFHFGRAMAYACDVWLDELLTDLEGQSAVVVYTSDHGQSILEGGMIASHGVSKSPPASQANVPLMLFGTNDETRALLDGLTKESLDHNRNRTSHFEIFATLLRLMGYDKEEIREHYGVSLFDKIPERTRRFYAGDPFRKKTRGLIVFD